MTEVKDKTGFIDKTFVDKVLVKVGEVKVTVGGEFGGDSWDEIAEVGVREEKIDIDFLIVGGLLSGELQVINGGDVLVEFEVIEEIETGVHCVRRM